MKTIVVLLAVLAACTTASAYGNGGGDNGNGNDSPSISTPPCPKNYLLSCQPNLVPAPCAPAPGGGSQGPIGAYSEYLPRFVDAPKVYQGLPQNLFHYPNYYRNHY